MPGLWTQVLNADGCDHMTCRDVRARWLSQGSESRESGQ